MWAVRRKKHNNSYGIPGKVQSLFFAVLIIGALFLTGTILLPYLSALFFALILSIVFRPLYTRVYRVVKSSNAAAFLSVLVVLFVIILPLVFFGILLFNEAYDFYSDGDFTTSSITWVETLDNRIQTFLNTFSPGISFDLENLANRVTGWFVGNLSAFFSKFVDAVLGLFIAALGLFYLFRDGEHVIKRLMFLSPLSDRYDEEIFKKIESAINSVVRGSLVVAIIQGFLSGIGFLIFGLPHPILWASVAMLTSLIPNVGTAVVLVPSVLYIFFSGDTVSAVGLLIWGAIAVGFIDNLLGPHLIERGIKIHPFLILLSVIGGITFFGPVGFIAGPVILSLLFALLDIYPSIVRASMRSR